jgi:curli biogenesis system outer membrane secretion channel CsgG
MTYSVRFPSGVCRPAALAFAALALSAIVTAPAAAQSRDDPVVGDPSHPAQALRALRRVPVNQRPVVTIYAFRGDVPGVDCDAATDMFTTALVQSGAFAVAERQRLVPDLTVEKQLNAQHFTSGDTATKQIAGARYIFEGTVSNLTGSDDQSDGGVSLGGMTLGGSGAKGELAIDVRIVDVDSGTVIDSIEVHKPIRSRAKHVSGVGNFLSSVSHSNFPLDADASADSAHQDNVGKALRACIDAAVLELVKRYGAAA